MIEVEYIALEGRKAYEPFIAFRLRIKNLSDGEITIWNSRDLVRINEQAVGYATTINASVIEPKSEKEILTILTIPYDVLERIEKSRSKEGKINLEIEYRPMLTCAGLDVDKVEELLKIKKYVLIPMVPNTTQIWLNCPVVDPKTKSTTIRVTTDEWLDFLSEVNYKRCRVIEVPAIDENEKTKQILEELDKAWRLMAENYPESLNACRKALEEIKEYMKSSGCESKGGMDFRRIYGGEKYGEAMDGFFRKIWLLTDIGSHTGRSKMTTRADMEFIITSIYMLLKSMLANLEANLG
ncbi:MAG: hypothetical protein N2V73_04235 [Candidatus Methanospirare jalkutatii]|nr:hypothetical protein [Candidatus Methanospirare jalkutatii]